MGVWKNIHIPGEREKVFVYLLSSPTSGNNYNLEKHFPYFNPIEVNVTLQHIVSAFVNKEMFFLRFPEDSKSGRVTMSCYLIWIEGWLSSVWKAMLFGNMTLQCELSMCLMAFLNSTYSWVRVNMISRLWYKMPTWTASLIFRFGIRFEQIWDEKFCRF